MDVEDIYKQLKQIKKTKVTLSDSILLNWKSHCAIFIAVYILYVDCYLKAIWTLKFSYLLWYAVHLMAHIMNKSLKVSSFSIFNAYHHENNNWLGLFLEIFVAELGFISWFALIFFSFVDKEMILSIKR